MNKIVVIDIESTCWAKRSTFNQSEIIEIGICLLDRDTLSLSDKRSIIVKPQLSLVSQFCTELTGLLQSDVEKGLSFAEACKIVEVDYLTKKRPWASYGQYDLNMFVQECKLKNVEYPFSNIHTNIKRLFAREMGLSREIGMAKALNLLKMSLDGVHHRGADDAWNIGKIYSYLLDKSRKK